MLLPGLAAPPPLQLRVVPVTRARASEQPGTPITTGNEVAERREDVPLDERVERANEVGVSE